MIRLLLPAALFVLFCVGLCSMQACATTDIAGRDACLAWVDAVNECMPGAVKSVDVCPGIMFDSSHAAECTWGPYFETCLETLTCEPDGVHYKCAGQCIPE
jgi:hypothetical protein